MPIQASRIRGPVLTQILNAFKQLNPKNVEKEANRPVRLGIVGREDLLQDVAAFLLGNDPRAFDRAAEVLLLLPTPLDTSALNMLHRCDIVLRSSEFRDPIPGIPSYRIFDFSSTDDLPGIVRRILQEHQVSYAALPLARVLPAFRNEVAISVVQTVSLENAIFVVSTSLGNVIPNPLQPLVAVAESLGDLVVLTANQLRMMFRIAAVFNQKLGMRDQAPEIASIVGASFGWRSIARELVGMLPAGAGIVPKAAIAFAGTWAVGDGIIYYYTTGKRMSREEMKERFDAALEKGRSAADGVIAKVKESYSRYIPGGSKPNLPPE